MITLTRLEIYNEAVAAILTPAPSPNPLRGGYEAGTYAPLHPVEDSRNYSAELMWRVL